MKPILLNGHTRSLTKIKYNAHGDLIFSCSKDHVPSVWYSDNGERIGTFNGHTGTVWDLDVSIDSSKLITASADTLVKLWDVSTGKIIHTWTFKTVARCVEFSQGEKMAVVVTDATMGQKSAFHIIQIADSPANQTDEIFMTCFVPGSSKATLARWGSLNEHLFVGHEDGSITVWDAASGEMERKLSFHTGQIQDIQFSLDKSYFITASKDNSSKIIDAFGFKLMKEFKTDRPVNAAAISPLKPHIILAGGQEAKDVTTTSVKQGKFEVYFFHRVFQEEIGRVKGHFGPINTLAFHPNGHSFASGGEDGYIRLHFFDPDYFEFKFQEEEGSIY